MNVALRVNGKTEHLDIDHDAAIGRKITDKAMITWEIAAPIVKDYPVYKRLSFG